MLTAALVVLILHTVVAVAGALLHGPEETGPTVIEIVGLVIGVAAIAMALVALRVIDHELKARDRITRELHESERKFAGILAVAADAIITVDQWQRIVHFNRGAEEIFGWRESEMLGQDLTLLIPDRFRDGHARLIAHFGQGREVARRMGERQEIFGLRRDRTEFPAEASISRLDLGDHQLYSVVLRDVTERRRQQQDERFLAAAGATLSATLDYESTLLSAVHLAIPHLADCCVLDVVEDGSALRRVVSVHDDPSITRRLRALETRNVEEEGWPLPSSAAMASGETIVRAPLAPGWEREGGPHALQGLVASLGLSAMMTVPLVARGRSLGALTLLRTSPSATFAPEARALAESLGKLTAFAIDNAWLYGTAQRATVARDEIVGVVSHDLRNPLSAIGMCARVLLASPGGDSSSQQELLGAILESTELMHRLIQDLLDVSTLESGHLTIHRQTESLPPLVARVLEMLGPAARERGVAIRADVPADFPELEVDGGRVVQVLANLVGNAVKFTESGGSVVVEARAGDGVAAIAVSDTGIGILPDHLPHIFDRYWHARRTARTVGTGLGLAIARGLVEAHGGRIWVESTPGRGSTFHFTLPLALPPLPSQSEAVPAAAVPAHATHP